MSRPNAALAEPRERDDLLPLAEPPPAALPGEVLREKIAALKARIDHQLSRHRSVAVLRARHVRLMARLIRIEMRAEREKH